MNYPKKSKKLKLFVLGGASALIILSAGCSSGNGEKSKSDNTAASAQASTASTQSAAEEKDYIEVTAKQYDADYDANEVSADNKYKGKKIKITGRIESIEKD